MANRAELIARKHEVRRQIEQVQRKLALAQQPVHAEHNARQIRKLQTELESLMAREYRLRVEIDRNR